MSSQNQDGKESITTIALDISTHFQAAQARHVQVEQNQIRSVLPNHRQRSQAVRGTADGMPLPTQGKFNQLSNLGLIIDNKNMTFRIPGHGFAP
jgi:hypothetical protein